MSSGVHKDLLNEIKLKEPFAANKVDVFSNSFYPSSLSSSNLVDVSANDEDEGEKASLLLRPRTRTASPPLIKPVNVTRIPSSTSHVDDSNGWYSASEFHDPQFRLCPTCLVNKNAGLSTTHCMVICFIFLFVISYSLV